MKLQKSFLIESPIENVQLDLKKAGYNDFKVKSKKVLVVLTDKNRTKVIEDILKKLPDAVYDSTPKSISSLGVIKDPRGVDIIVKPKSRQGVNSAGVGNEHFLVEKITEAINNNDIDTIVFQSPVKSYIIKDVIEVKSVGTSTKGRKKADIVITTKQGKQHNISIKKDDAEMWESADSYWKEKALKYINDLKEKT